MGIRRHFDTPWKPTREHAARHYVVMLIVVLDSNPIHGDPWLASPPGASLVELAESGSCLVIFPDVVRDELHRQKREAAQESHAEAAKGINAMAKAGIDVAETEAHLKKSFERINDDIDAAFTALFDREGISTEPIPDIPVASVVERDLARRRPFQEIVHGQKKKSLGFRDVVIWETVLAILDPARGDDKVLFVSADGGFLSKDSKSIHPHLLDDLSNRGIDRDRLVSVKNVPQAVTEIKATAAQAAQARAATDALYELVGQEAGLQLVHGGDYDYPDFVKFSVPEIDSPYIGDIDQISEFELSAEGETVTATAEAIVYLEGGVFKGDWFMDDDGSVRIQGELNKHYFEASSDVPVRVVVEIDTSGDSPQVVRVELEDPVGAEDPEDEAIAQQ